MVSISLSDLADPQVLGATLAALAAAATVYTLAMPLLEGSGLQSRMKAVGAERERIRGGSGSGSPAGLSSRSVRHPKRT